MQAAAGAAAGASVDLFAGNLLNFPVILRKDDPKADYWLVMLGWIANGAGTVGIGHTATIIREIEWLVVDGQGGLAEPYAEGRTDSVPTTQYGVIHIPRILMTHPNSTAVKLLTILGINPRIVTEPTDCMCTDALAYQTTDVINSVVRGIPSPPTNRAIVFTCNVRDTKPTPEEKFIWSWFNIKAIPIQLCAPQAVPQAVPQAMLQAMPQAMPRQPQAGTFWLIAARTTLAATVAANDILFGSMVQGGPYQECINVVGASGTVVQIAWNNGAPNLTFELLMPYSR